jgi:hypothetical protein
MSIEARMQVVKSSRVFFQHDSDRADFINPNTTNSNLVALVLHSLDDGFNIEFTAVNTDHHYDGTTEHSAGLAFDSWPLASAHAGDDFPGIRNIGLAAEAYTPGNVAATGLPEVTDVEDASGPVVFRDDGGSHVHFDVHPA